MEIAIMIEGQNGLNWPRWQKLAAAVEDLGYAVGAADLCAAGVGADAPARPHGARAAGAWAARRFVSAWRERSCASGSPPSWRTGRRAR